MNKEHTEHILTSIVTTNFSKNVNSDNTNTDTYIFVHLCVFTAVVCIVFRLQYVWHWNRHHDVWILEAF